MIEKSLYEDYEIDFSDSHTSNDAYYFIFNNKRELCLTDEHKLPETVGNLKIDFKLYIGKYNKKDTFVINCEGDDSFYNLKDVYDISHDLYLMATRAVLVRDWYMTHNNVMSLYCFVPH
ncbi:MAG: hypothetical protein IJF83_06210 [Methanobrevibacter sp.]|nr:hypothetical protein [Methanobrevibacter sp.]